MKDKKVKLKWLIEKSGKKVGDIVEVSEEMADFLVAKGDAEFMKNNGVSTGNGGVKNKEKEGITLIQDVGEKMRDKKKILDNLYYNTGKQNFDFFLAGTYIKDGEKCFTKWKKYSECVFPIGMDGTSDDFKEQGFFEQINQRQIFPNEIVLDLEEKDQIKPVLEKLKSMKTIKPEEYKIYETGRRVWHLHIFFKYNIN